MIKKTCRIPPSMSPKDKYKLQKNGAQSMHEKNLLRAGFEPATYGYLFDYAIYSPPLYQLSYRRGIERWEFTLAMQTAEGILTF